MKRVLPLALLAFFLSASCSSTQNEKDKADESGVTDKGKKEQKEKGSSAKKKIWDDEEVMEPKKLAAMIEDSSEKLPLIHCVGPMAMIPHSEHFGEAHKDSALQAYRKALRSVPKDTSLVFYCGCCPFEDCPNIRPAYRLLEEKGFEDFKLLGLDTSLKANWMDKGFPVRSEQGS